MVSVPYKVPLPASPPPSPPRGPASTVLSRPTTPPNNTAALKSLVNPVPIPSPDVSHDDLNLSPQRVARSEQNSLRSNRRPSAPRLNDFELIRVLGKGCAGRVLLVKHTPTARVHAMKAISKRAVLANDELDHTLAEQRILRHFTARERRSAFVSRLYYSFCDKENFYLVMEFYPGGDLATQMEIHGILGPLRTRFYTCDIVAGLDALEGILVRDLKPENILLNWHGHAVLADFGLSKSFGYRGDPIPVKLPADYIEGKGTPPPHAGKGFGSYRGGELTWDRAYSFVGTQEYLAPEVIKRNHYTYAIDWWALGCIVCECLTGRVPFRGHDDESNAELYERVVNAPWDAMYRGDHPRSYLKERYRIDSTTYDFIDGLLAKEPMFRLTEPCVKTHPYFTNVDWETVEKGDYQDPFQLEIDPVAEYNTQFFPRLCLEETPTVDMSGHDYGKEPDGEQNALNNDAIYAQAQLDFRKELESFEWTCSSSFWDDQSSENQSDVQSQASDVQDVHDTVEEGVDDDAVDGVEDGGEDGGDEADMGEAEEEPERAIHKPVVHETIQEEEMSEQQQDADEPMDSDEPVETADEGEFTSEIASATDHGGESVTDTIPTMPSEMSENHIESLKDDPDSDEESQLAYRLPSSKPPSVHSTAPSVASTTRSSAAVCTPIHNASSQGSIKSAKTASVRAPSIAPSVKAPSRAPSIVLPPPSEAPVERRPTVDSIPSVTVESIDSPISPMIPSSLGIAQDTEGIVPRLPSGPPQSGLSVSDVISIPLRDGGIPNLIIRRHRQVPSIDRFNHARLSVELNGTFGQLGDEDWEQLDMNANEIPEAVNGANASGHSGFFSRGFGGVLGRKQGGRLVSMRSGRSTSTRVPSGLRKAVTSDSESSSEPAAVTSTPAKSRPPLFASRGIENTKRAFTRIKAFPPSKRVGSNGSSRMSAQSSASPSPVASIRGVAPSGSQRSLSIRDPSIDDWHRSITSTLSPNGKRSARGDLPSIFSRPKARRAVTQSTLEVQRAAAPSRSSASDGGSTTTLESTTTVPVASSSSSPPVSGPATPAVTAQIAGGLPRLELTATAPIVWDLSLGSPGSENRH